MPESGFLMDLNAAVLFFRFCRRYKINDRPGRMQVLGRIAKRGQAKYLRDISSVTDGKNVLRVTKQRSQNEN